MKLEWKYKLEFYVPNEIKFENEKLDFSLKKYQNFVLKMEIKLKNEVKKWSERFWVLNKWELQN